MPGVIGTLSIEAAARYLKARDTDGSCSATDLARAMSKRS
jgi:hypothetical protein